MARRSTSSSRGLQLPGSLRRSQGRLLQRGLLVLGRLLGGGRPGRPMLRMLLLQALLLQQLVLLLLRIDLQCARRPPKGVSSGALCSMWGASGALF